MSPKTLLDLIKKQSDTITFAEIIATIDSSYDYTPTTFTNGIGDDSITNPAGTNEGSCKTFAFAKLNGLTREEALICFGEHYRSVVADPEGDDHGNIRRFMRHGWAGINFTSLPLSPKA